MTENQATDDGFSPEYQRGRTSVEHRNIDAAGEDHPFGDEPRSFEADLRHLIRKVADDLYDSWQAAPREYLANAETATLKVEQYLENPESLPYDTVIVDNNYEPKIEVTWNRKEETLIIKDNGIGMAAAEVDEIFRQIGHSAARDDGTKSGQFGMGALSFVKLVGLDNAMIMTSHSRLNDDNAAYYVTLAGVEPIQGSLDDDEYGTRFQMTPNDDYNIRPVIEQYAEWMRVPVIYREYDEEGQEVFNEDWGDKSLHEDYSDDVPKLGIRKGQAFEAYCSPDAEGRTLLLSMDISRNDVSREERHGAPFQFDVRILDESGKVIESDNGNEGLMPCPRSDYESMLLDARHPYITEELLNNGDIVGQEVTAGPNEGSIVVDGAVLESNKPLPPGDYITRDEVQEDDEPGEAEVLIGPNQGRTIVPEDEWEEMDEGRASLYVPEDELEQFNVGDGTGDLTLPEPTSDRDRLQSHETFWKYVGQRFKGKFEDTVREISEAVDNADEPIEKVVELDPQDFWLALHGTRKVSSGRRNTPGNLKRAFSDNYNADIDKQTAMLLEECRVSRKPASRSSDTEPDEAPDYLCKAAIAANLDIAELSEISVQMSHGLASRNSTHVERKNNRDTVYLPKVHCNAGDGDVYMAKSTGGAFKMKARMVWDMNDDNIVVVVDEYDKWEDLLGWKKLKELPHGRKEIREQLGDVLSDDLLEEVAPKEPDTSDDSDSDSSITTSKKSRSVEDRRLNMAKSPSHSSRVKMSVGDIYEKLDDEGKITPDYRYSNDINRLILFPSSTDLKLSEHYWIGGSIGDEKYAAVANCTNKVYDHLKDFDEVMHIDDYLEQSKDYKVETTEGEMTVPEGGSRLIVHVVSPDIYDKVSHGIVFETMPDVLPDYHNETRYRDVEFPDDPIYMPVTSEEMFWLRPILRELGTDDGAPTVVAGGSGVRDLKHYHTLSNDLKLYMRTRLPEWDYESTEIDALDSAARSISINDGGYELIETLATVHDAGIQPFSERGDDDGAE